MRASELRELDEVDFLSRVRQLEKELFDLRIQVAQGRMTNSSRLKQVKRDIARAKTIWREKELSLRQEKRS